MSDLIPRQPKRLETIDGDENSLDTDSDLSEKGDNLQNFSLNLRQAKPKRRQSTIFLMKTKINEKDSTESLSFESSDADSFSSFRRRIKRTFLEKDDRGKNETLESLVDKLRKQNDMNR